jgi:hypothetical protein
MDPIELELVSSSYDRATHLEIAASTGLDPAVSLADRALLLLQNANRPLTRTAIREHLKVNNQRLGHTLDNLNKQALVLKTAKGWIPLPTQRLKQLSISGEALD